MMLPKANAKSLKTIGDSKKEGEVNQDVPEGYELFVPVVGDVYPNGVMIKSINGPWTNSVLSGVKVVNPCNESKRYCRPISKSKRPSPPEGYRFARVGEPYGPDFWEYPKDTNNGRKKVWTHTVYTKDRGITFTLNVLKFWYVAVPIKAAPENATVTPEQVAVAMAVKYGESLGLVSEPPQLPNGYTLAGEGHIRSRATIFKMKDSPNDAWSSCKPEGIGKPISDKSAAKVWYAIPVVNVAYFPDLPKDHEYVERDSIITYGLKHAKNGEWHDCAGGMVGRKGRDHGGLAYKNMCQPILNTWEWAKAAMKAGKVVTSNAWINPYVVDSTRTTLFSTDGDLYIKGPHTGNTPSKREWIGYGKYGKHVAEWVEYTPQPEAPVLTKQADAPEGYRWAEKHETKGVVLVDSNDGSIREWRQCGNQPPMYFSYDGTGDNPFCRPAIKKVTKEEVEAARREFVAAREASNKAFIEYHRLEGECSTGR